ncbi:hypothetical protein [Corynebacterium accolens]|jgi:hypothetical protein|uniref:hypothetical protein n=1 Tax=Corynebacterium accolens TaxID=38284 RepID=UPI00204AAB1A|nr:hypothetical protein [Corynebacterium accolens]WKS56812.1 hypothetical protein NLL31_05095 [Corynebacterium accolens]DAI33677.1 MAG TPA: hypothetical protein [Caudoviricetes sp.]
MNYKQEIANKKNEYNTIIAERNNATSREEYNYHQARADRAARQIAELQNEAMNAAIAAL